MKERKVLVLMGLQGSGKTTFAKQWVGEAPESRVRFNRDDVRNMLGKYWVPSREDLVTAIYDTFLKESMLSGYDIVIDNMNLNPKCLSEIENEVEEFNEWSRLSPDPIHYTIEKKDFFTVPVSLCIERDSKRDKPVGESVIRSTYNKYKHLYEPWKYLT